MNLKTEKDFNCYEDYQGYVQGLISQGVLCEGCTYCMTNGCSCSLKNAVEKSKGDWVSCTPMSYVPEDLYYPVACAKDWFGEEYIKENCQN